MPEEETVSPSPEGTPVPDAESPPEPEAEAQAPEASAEGEPAPKPKAARPPKEPKEPKEVVAAGAEGEAAAKPKAARVAKEKPPAPEAKPFPEFIAQEYLPGLTKAFAARGVSDLSLSFENSQVTGKWMGGRRQFTVYFTKPDIDAQKAFSCSQDAPPSTIEPFLIDERKAPLDLLVFRVIQRLNAEKWFAPN